MAIALKLDAATGREARLAVADSIEVAAVEPRVTTTDLVIGATLTSTAEVRLHAAGRITRVMGDLIVDENLTVSGTTTSVESETVLLADNHLYLNAGYETVAAQTGGMVVNYLPIATTDTVAAGGFTGATTVATTSAGDLSGAGNFVQITGAANPANNGIFEVLTHAGNVLTIDATPGDDFSQTAFVTDATVAGSMTLLNISVMRTGTDGIWETALGAVAPLSFTNLGSGAGNSLQAAYVEGNTITVTTAEGVVALNNAADLTDVMSITRTFVGAGEGLSIAMGPGNEAVTGRGLEIISGTASTGAMAFINNLGSGNALQVQDGSTDVMVVSATGGVALTAQVASSFSTVAGNLSFDAAAAELVFDDVGNQALTLSQASDRVLSPAADTPVLTGSTSMIGAINDLARAMDVDGQGGVKDYPIEGTIAITAGDVIAQSTTADRVTLMDANGDTNARFIGIALETATGDGGGGVNVRVALTGNYVTSGSGFTAGAALFAPDTTGPATESAPASVGDILMRIGWAHNATTFVIDPGPAFIL